MKTRIRTVPGWYLLGLCLLGSPEGAADQTCPCHSKKPMGDWCEEHRAAHVAGVKITSYELFETLDAHGHVLNAERGCATCKAARATDGYCDTHGIGFVDDLGYMSRLTYHLARATPVRPESLACATCREHAASHGWCDDCGRGIVGNVAVDDRKDYEELAAAYRNLLSANETAVRCELCAASMVLEDGFCPVHRIRYKNGERVGPQP